MILASHGELSKGMLNSIKMIVGDLAKEVEAYTLYPGESPSDYTDSMKSEIVESKDTEFLFLSDIKGGSVYNAILTLTEYENVKLFSGMNMNMLLDILLSHKNPMKKEEVEEVMRVSKEGITYSDVYSLNEASIKLDEF